MNSLIEYVEGRNRIRAMFKQRPLSLDNAKDRQQLADDIDCSLSPENLTCDGELSGSMVERKYRMLTKVAKQLKAIDPSVTFMELA
jgi:hypothetical protein